MPALALLSACACACDGGGLFVCVGGGDREGCTRSRSIYSKLVIVKMYCQKLKIYRKEWCA